MPSYVKKFTAAHEIGHWILHQKRQQFRDSPVDGGRRRVRKSIEEVEADYFAATLLMPEKLVRREFKSHFGVKTLAAMPIDESLMSILSFGGKELKIAALKKDRDISQLAARCLSMNKAGLGSMADRFGVSVDAMAIRFEELGLVPVLHQRDSMKYDVFISYDRENERAAHHLFSELKRRGFNPWYDALLPPGSEWHIEIEAAVKASRTALIIVGPEEFGGFQVTEVLSFGDLKRPVIPVFIAGWNGVIPFLLRRFQGVDWRKRTPEALERIIKESLMVPMARELTIEIL